MKEDFNLKSTESDKQISHFLFDITSDWYQFASADSNHIDQADSENVPIDNTTYQLLPNNASDPFFDWYCRVRMYHQFFANKTACLQCFLKYYILWISEGKPSKKIPLVQEIEL